jgi:hypothetical protein
MKHCFLLSVLFFTTLSYAQKYSGSFEAGVTNGNFETNAYLNTSHGLAVSSWYLGFGSGVDYYRFRTIPVFAEMRKEFSKKNTRPFIQLAGGINIQWLTQEQRDHRFTWWQTNPSTFKPGVYFKGGTGVLFNTHKLVRFATTVSWSYKSLTEKYNDRVWDPWPQPGNSLTEKTLLYNLQRVDIGVKVIF